MSSFSPSRGLGGGRLADKGKGLSSKGSDKTRFALIGGGGTVRKMLWYKETKSCFASKH